jgi:hypothetical protein
VLRFVTLRWRTASLVAGATLVAIAWYASFTAGAELRLVDFARLAQTESSGGVLGAVARWWFALSTVPWRADLAIGLVQAACIPVVLIAIVRRTGSLAVAVATAAVILAFSLPAHWLGRPLGADPALAVLGLVVVFAGYLDGGARARRAMPIAGFAAALSAGWPIVPIAVLALLRRDRTTAEVAIAAALATVVRMVLGIPPSHAFGTWSASEPHAELGLQIVFWAVVFVPAVLFVATRPAVREPLARFVRADTLLPPALAAVVLGIAGTFLADGSAAIFAACAALLLVVGLSVAKRESPAVRIGALVCAVVFVAAGAADRVRHPPPDDAASVAVDESSVRDAAAVNGSLIVVDRGDDSVSRRFPPFVLTYLAARPVTVQYAAQPPPAAAGGIVEATAHGLVRIDPSLRALRSLDDARRSVRYDLYAHRRDGKINSSQHESTPSGLGVIPSFVLTGPDRQVPTITVLAGYTWTFDHVPVSPKSSLVFAGTKAFPVGHAARATVTVTFPGRRPIVADTELPPADPSGLAAWQFRSIPLDPPRTVIARIVFSASSPSGYNLADWASFGLPSIVGPPR